MSEQAIHVPDIPEHLRPIAQAMPGVALNSDDVLLLSKLIPIVRGIRHTLTRAANLEMVATSVFISGCDTSVLICDALRSDYAEIEALAREHGAQTIIRALALCKQHPFADPTKPETL